MIPQAGIQLKFNFGFQIEPALRLSEVEKILRITRAIIPEPSRVNLISLIESGVLKGKLTSYGWIVYEDSFKEWVKSSQPEKEEVKQ